MINSAYLFIYDVSTLAAGTKKCFDCFAVCLRSLDICNYLYVHVYVCMYALFQL